MLQSAPKRHSLSSGQARDLSRKILGYARADYTRVNINSGIRGFTRTAINRITTAGETNDVNVRITSVLGKRVVAGDTNRLDDASLERAVRDSESLARIAPENPEYMPELGEQKYIAVNGYYASTGELTTESRARAASLAIKAADAGKFDAAGYIDTTAGSEAA